MESPRSDGSALHSGNGCPDASFESNRSVPSGIKSVQQFSECYSRGRSEASSSELVAEFPTFEDEPRIKKDLAVVARP
jgi:hypothetical protein